MDLSVKGLIRSIGQRELEQLWVNCHVIRKISLCSFSDVRTTYRTGWNHPVVKPGKNLGGAEKKMPQRHGTTTTPHERQI